VVTDHTKFGRRGLVQVAGFEAIGNLVTDEPVSDEIAATLEGGGTRLIIGDRAAVPESEAPGE
jgi:DeoR family glycerol-3-phosphate regulon repressor